MLFKEKKIEVVPNGVSTDIFKKRDKNFARNLFNMPRDKILLLFGADKAERKGQQKLAESMDILSASVDMSKIGLITFGGLKDTFLSGKRISLHRLGYITDELLLSCVYSAADLLLLPSSQDNLPTILLEAAACSLPALGFDVGGIGEFIEAGKNGFIVKPNDAKGLAEKIKWLINHRQHLDLMAKKSRSLVEERYSIHNQAEQYYRIYQKILKPAAI